MAELTTAALLCITGGDEFAMNFDNYHKNLAEKGVANVRESPSETVRKGYEQCSNREFDRYTEHKTGPERDFRRPVGLRRKRLRDFSDSFSSGHFSESGPGPRRALVR